LKTTAGTIVILGEVQDLSATSKFLA
jgi:hypothetical protein